MVTANAGGPGTAANKVDLLVSPGNVPTVAAANPWTTGTDVDIVANMVANTPSYTLKTSSSPYGWNGPYLSSTVGADAWNNRYMINVGLIDTRSGDADRRRRDQERCLGDLGRRERPDRNGLQPANHDCGRGRRRHRRPRAVDSAESRGTVLTEPI